MRSTGRGGKMKKSVKKLVAMLLAAVMTFSLTGCIQTFDATAYVQAELDLVTRHDVDQYVELLGVSKEEAEDIYAESMEEMDVVESIFSEVQVSDEVAQGYEKWVSDVMQKTKYTVLEAEEVEDGYVVVVEVQPIKAMEGASGALATKTEAYMNEILNNATSGTAIPSDAEINEKVYSMLLDILNNILETVTYGETISVETKIILNDDGVYEIDEASFEELGAKLIDITDSTSEEAAAQ